MEETNRVTDLHKHKHTKRLAHTHPHAKFSGIYNEYNTNALMQKLAHAHTQTSFLFKQRWNRHTFSLWVMN